MANSLRKLRLYFVVAGGCALAACQSAPATRVMTIDTGPLLIDRLYRSMDGPNERMPVNTEDLDWITAYKTEVLDSATLGKMGNEFFCHSQLQLSNLTRLLVTATGSEEIVFPDGYGMPLTQIVGGIPNPDWRQVSVLGMVLNNHQPNMHKLTRVRATMNYMTDDEAKARGLKKLYKVELPMTVQPAPGEAPNVVSGGEHCVLVEGQKSHWMVPPGPQVTRKRYEAVFPVDATAHFVNAHLHNHGTRMRLVDLTEGKVVWETQVEYDSRRQIVRIPEYSSAQGFPVYKDHVYEIEAYYENTSPEAVNAMAAVYVYYHPLTDVNITYPFGPPEGADPISARS